MRNGRVKVLSISELLFSRMVPSREETRLALVGLQEHSTATFAWFSRAEGIQAIGLSSDTVLSLLQFHDVLEVKADMEIFLAWLKKIEFLDKSDFINRLTSNLCSETNIRKRRIPTGDCSLWLRSISRQLPALHKLKTVSEQTANLFDTSPSLP
ncbi:unnamed protein product [Mortierella alpina]